ncbi:ubiquitin-like protein ISG15 [Takifugu flavidus]|uniref:Ubiquitin-like domain-containing protein n=1 Tax=Takifugu flavidus TaxID=433684 RepID=A0A5C6N3U2_9TELE|nr:ubiquitin-like protein ISG15 [Takifugu flavidus]TWW60397.1 hypothetical protein D4764_05G0004870 [Takifugu flavidus]
MDITVIMMDGTSCSLRVNPQDTVGSLKAKIHTVLGVDPARQRLVLLIGDQKKTLSDDSLSLGSCGLQSGSVISLLLTEPTTIQVFLKKQDGNVNTYKIKPDETVTAFKQQVQAREGVQASQQRLLHESREMMDGGRLSDYNVKALSTIVLMLHLRGG